MRHRSRRGIGLVALTSAAVIGLSLAGPGTALAGGGGHGGSGSSPGDMSDYATGLNNPRQLSFTPRGDLLVAEAGIGGAGPCITGPEGPACLGSTGSITKVTAPLRQYRLISGLPSLAGAGGGAASGPSDVYSDGRSVSVLMGLGGDTEDRDALGSGGAQLGKLIQTRGTDYTKFRTIADLAGWEQDNHPVNDPDAPDSNPVGMLYDCGRYVVADAGGNDVLTVSQSGKINWLALFQPRLIDPGIPGLPNPFSMQAVPTSVATKGYDGAYYVSQLTGFPFPKGAANIYRIDPRTQTANPKPYASGLTNVTDLAFNGRDLYAVQIATNGLSATPEGELPKGSLVKIKPGGGAGDHKVIAGDLTAAYGIAIRNGSAYVTTGAVVPGGGKVIKIRL